MQQRSNIDVREVLNAVSKRMGGRPLLCEICGGSRWHGGDVVALHPTQSGTPVGTLNVGGPFLPMFILTCEICGNSKFLNMVRLGFFPPMDNAPQGPTDVDTLLRDVFGDKGRQP